MTRLAVVTFNKAVDGDTFFNNTLASKGTRFKPKASFGAPPRPDSSTEELIA